jgi:hypothetical protein
MSYVGEPFKHDLFVSYSHGDFDRSGHSNLKKWSMAFVRELEGELSLHPNFREIKVFLDEHHRPDHGLDPMEPLTSELRQEILASGLLIPLISPHYFRSKWCDDELTAWVRGQQEQGLAVDGRPMASGLGRSAGRASRRLFFL